MRAILGAVASTFGGLIGGFDSKLEPSLFCAYFACKSASSTVFFMPTAVKSIGGCRSERKWISLKEAWCRLKRKNRFQILPVYYVYGLG